MNKKLVVIGLGVFIATAWPASSASRRSPSAPNGADFEAELVRCADVRVPSPLLNCGTDPLVRGEAEIKKQGDIEIAVVGAAPASAYDVVYRSLDASTELPLGKLTTNNSGDGVLRQRGFFPVGTTGAGTIVLKRDGQDQFLSGFDASNAEETQEFEAGLVRCSEVTQPASLASCGTDRLLMGKAEIEEEGEVEVTVVRAEPNQTYDVFYRSPDGSTQAPLGPLATNRAGNGRLKLPNFFLSEIGSGNIVLRRNGQDQFVTGFKVNQGGNGRGRGRGRG